MRGLPPQTCWLPGQKSALLCLANRSVRSPANLARRQNCLKRRHAFACVQRVAQLYLEEFLARYGLWALGIGAGLEGETATVLGGIMAHHGLFPFLPAVLAASLGSFLADQTFFAIGRHFRDAGFVRRVSAKPAFRRALVVFEQHPVGFVFVFRFLYGLRTVSPLAIGTTTLRASRFMAINAAAALLWGTCFVTLGYLFGHGIEAMFGRVRSLEMLLVPLAALVGGGCVVRYMVVRVRCELKGSG